MYGILTSDTTLARTNVGEFVHFVTDDVSGRRGTPLDGVVNAVACWGNTEIVRDDPDRAAITTKGTRATPETEGHHWGTVCPTDPDYRAGLLDRIETVGDDGDIRLTTPGFPGGGFCRCERCERRFATSEFDDRVAGGRRPSHGSSGKRKIGSRETLSSHCTRIRIPAISAPAPG